MLFAVVPPVKVAPVTYQVEFVLRGVCELVKDCCYRHGARDIPPYADSKYARVFCAIAGECESPAYAFTRGIQKPPSVKGDAVLVLVNTEHACGICGDGIIALAKPNKRGDKDDNGQNTKNN